MSSLERIIRLGGCRGSNDPRLIADEPHARVAPADILMMCGACPVQGECLTYALETEAPDGEAGIWGGLTQYQRRQLRTDRARVHCPACLSEAVMQSARGEVCLSCGMSWMV